MKFLLQSFGQGHYRLTYRQTRKEFDIYFVTLQLMNVLYCGEDKTDSEGFTAHLQLMKSMLLSLLDFITL